MTGLRMGVAFLRGCRGGGVAADADDAQWCSSAGILT